MSKDKTEQILAEDLSHLPPASAGAPFNFVHEAITFLRRWCSTYSGQIPLGSPAYCCFIGCERVLDEAGSASGFVKRLFFREDTPQDLLGRVYLCSFPFNNIHARPAVFANFGDCEEAISAFGAINHPTVLFNAADGRVLWRIATADPYHQIMIRDQPIPKLTSGQFDKALDEFHVKYTETPEGWSIPWQNATELLTKPQLEKEIRNDLFLYIRYLMQDDHPAVFTEFQNSSGRADLLIYFYAEKQTFYIELKVLREFRLSKAKKRHVPQKVNARWGKMGIAQAHSYKRANGNAGISYACCFDARKKNEEIAEFVELAHRLEVRYKRFFMYPSTEKLHEALMN